MKKCDRHQNYVFISGVIVFSLDSCNREKDKKFSEQVIGSRALDYNTERFTIMSSDFPNQEAVAALVLDGNTLVVNENVS